MYDPLWGQRVIIQGSSRTYHILLTLLHHCKGKVMSAPHDLQDWQEQLCREPHQTTLESKDLAFLESERDLSTYVFLNDISLFFCFLILG